MNKEKVFGILLIEFLKEKLKRKLLIHKVILLEEF